MSNRPPSRTGNRSVIYPGEVYAFPPPIGEARIKFDHDAMEWIEEALEPELDKLNARILDGRGPLDDHTGEPIEFPFDSVWDALGELSARRVARVTGVLVTGGLAHRHDGDVDARLAQARDEVGQMPFHLWNEEELHVALNRSLRVAFGRDLDEDEAQLPPPPAPPAPGGASGSDGTTSSPPGPPPSRPED